MAGGDRRKLGHATPRELFPSKGHANTETSQEVTPSPEQGVGGSGTSTQVPETQDGNSPMGEVPTPVARRTLHPTGLWFDDNTVSTSITNIFQAHWREPWLNYEMVDKDTKTHWWNSFTKQYLWNADLDALVKNEYEKKAHKRLKEITYNALVRNKSVPKWMGKSMFERIMAKRKDLVFLERSEKAKKNRRGGSLSNPIESSHFQGSISASKHAKKMAQKAGGELPTAPEVFLKTHFKEVPGKGKVAANKRA